MTERDEPDACCPAYPGAIAWLLEDVRKIETFPVRGRPGYFEAGLTGGSPVRRTSIARKSVAADLPARRSS